jgi:hypothetical protein
VLDWGVGGGTIKLEDLKWEMFTSTSYVQQLGLKILNGKYWLLQTRETTVKKQNVKLASILLVVFLFKTDFLSWKKVSDESKPFLNLLFPLTSLIWTRIFTKPKIVEVLFDGKKRYFSNKLLKHENFIKY